MTLYEYAEKDKKLISELLFLIIRIFKTKRKRLISFQWDKRPGEKILHQKLLESLLCIICILPLSLFCSSLLFPLIWCNYSKMDSWVPAHHHSQLDTFEWRWWMVHRRHHHHHHHHSNNSPFVSVCEQTICASVFILINIEV